MTYLYANNAAGTLAAGITSTATSLTLNTGQAALFPSPTSPDSFFATLTAGSGTGTPASQIEIVSVTAVSSNTFTITRAQDGTSAFSWSAGDVISQRAIAAEYRQWQGIVPIGGIILWSGAANMIPENWALCNGLNGTPNLQDKFVIGAGNTYTVGATGGATTATLAIANLPAHSHGVNDPTHAHVVNDPTHAHAITDPSHYHPLIDTGGNLASAITTNNANPLSPGGTGGNVSVSNRTQSVTTGISINASGTGISLQAAATGITIQNTGSGTAFGILPPYYALCFIMRTS